MKYKIKKHIVIVIIIMIVTVPILNFTEDISGKLIASIFATLKGKEYSESKVLLDDSGLPVVDYGYINGIYVGKQINPLTVSRRAIGYLEEYKNGDENSRRLFFNSVDWLVDNAIQYDNYTIWEYNFPYTYNMTPPWRSGMTQGQAILALTRAYNFTRDERYLNAARTALNSFFIEVEKGGVTHKENEGWWYEEYADENGSNPRVLNGMIFALLGIYEYYELTGDENARFLFDKGIVALKNHLSEYDTGGWTYYDALGTPASEFYHNIHVTQLSQIYNITKEPVFKKYHDKWKGYENSPLRFLFKFIGQPSMTGIAIYVSNFLPLFILSEITVFLIGIIKKKDKK